ncbi:HPr kinase/phosphorylase [Microvirga subterranea]|uniref:HPr serine kinase-like protein n=1 Tax=Microvirga subterranea TaxID=186651 RepID=A0A370HVF1_9HYPH|nr:HPr kinase/phosphatase C-terminal domain-containing protein [Microvirga subterranea]RDI62487.1 HPr serine kinase-like protein [Microvirga subterranea]
MTGPETIHASCVVVGEAGLLIRGPSGAGKSSLVREILFRAGRTGRFCRLVSDDRTRLAAQHGRLVASPVEPLSGCLEVRGVGIVRSPFEPAAVVRLVIDLSEDPERYPGDRDGRVELCGVMVPRLCGRAGASSADIAIARLSGVCDTVVTL